MEVDVKPAVKFEDLKFDRRVLLQGFALALPSLALGNLPKLAGLDTDVTNNLPYRLRDLEKAYKLWQEQSDITTFPSFEKFAEGVNICRSAACSIHFVDNNRLAGTHSAFLISIPEEHQTSQSRNKQYIVTCDHTRAANIHGAARIVLINGTNVYAYKQIVEKYGPNGFPTKDLRIYECLDEGQFKNVAKIPLRAINAQLPVGTAAMIYEPLNCRTPTQINTSTGNIEAFLSQNSKPPLETFVLTKVNKSDGYSSEDPNHPLKPDSNYPQNSGFLTAGQLKSGGSGSPTLVFDKDNFYLAGYQVSYVPEAESEDSVDGELRADGRIVHANNIIELLKIYQLWR